MSCPHTCPERVSAKSTTAGIDWICCKTQKNLWAISKISCKRVTREQIDNDKCSVKLGLQRKPATIRLRIPSKLYDYLTSIATISSFSQDEVK